jgi:L-lactate dehydrogenase complex protein LldG
MKARILERVREALAGRTAPDHPGRLETSAPTASEAVALLVARMEENGCEVHRFKGPAEAQAWLEGFRAGFASAACASDVPGPLRPALDPAAPGEADMGVSIAPGAAAESGSLLLDSRQGRLLQTLPPVHLVWLYEKDVSGSLEACLERARDLPASALALHSGPSRSADIGQIMVQGVHGPGRLVVGILAKDPGFSVAHIMDS